MSTPQGLTVVERKARKAYYFQARIPKDCLPHFPKAIIKERLPTKDEGEARVLARERMADLEAQFDRIRKTGTRLKQTITQRDIERLVLVWKARELAADEDDRPGYADETFAALGQDWEAVETVLRSEYARRKPDMLLPGISQFLAAEGYNLPPDTGVDPVWWTRILL